MGSLIEPRDRRYYLFGLRIVGDFGATLAVPVVLFVLVGQWLDERSGAYPRYTIAAFVLAAILSARLVYKKAQRYAKEYDALMKATPQEKKP